MITDEDIAAALDRLAKTPDGALLYRYCQKVLMGIPPTTDSGALQSHHGERTFAAKLMSLMSKGLEESGRRPESSSGSPGSPVVFVTGGARPVGGAGRGAGRRVPAEPGTEPEG